MRYNIYRETITRGCTFEDGSDTRKTTSEIIFVPENQYNDYQEHCADEAGSQDYSFRFDSNFLIKLDVDELMTISNFVRKEIEGVESQ